VLYDESQEISAMRVGLTHPSPRQPRAGSLWPLARWLTSDAAIIERAPSSDNASLEHSHSRSKAWMPRGESARAERTPARCPW
jgi:hypothetical protein